jgi:hypothetical protein
MTTASEGVPYSLYTHCGVRDVRIGDVYYVAEAPLDDGHGNPPPGWDNPYQQGTITFLEDGVVRFHDELGHVVRFRACPDVETPDNLRL